MLLSTDAPDCGLPFASLPGEGRLGIPQLAALLPPQLAALAWAWPQMR